MLTTTIGRGGATPCYRGQLIPMKFCIFFTNSLFIAKLFTGADDPDSFFRLASPLKISQAPTVDGLGMYQDSSQYLATQTGIVVHNAIMVPFTLGSGLRWEGRPPRA